MIYQQLDKCYIVHEDINALVFHYTNIMFQYHKFIYLDRKNNRIVVYDADSGETVNTIEQCGSDILDGDRGIYNIWLREW